MYRIDVSKLENYRLTTASKVKSQSQLFPSYYDILRFEEY